MNESNETTDLHKEQPGAKVIPFPKRTQGLSMRQAYNEEREFAERMARIREKIQSINKMIHDAHISEQKEK